MTIAETTRPKNTLAGQKPAPGFFCENRPKPRPVLLPQTLGTHQESATCVYVFVSGYTEAPVSGLADGPEGTKDTTVPWANAWLFERGKDKHYLIVFKGSELDRGKTDGTGQRVTDMKHTQKFPKLAGFQVTLYDLDATEKPTLSGKYDGFVFRQHGDLESPSGFTNTDLANAFIKVAPELKGYLGEGAWVAWSHCYGQGREAYLNAMKGGLGIERIKVSSGAETGYDSYKGQFVFWGGVWVDK